MLLSFSIPAMRPHPYDLHLWWKSRTSERAALGVVRGGGRIYPVTILHSTVAAATCEPYEIYRIDGARGWRDGDAVLFWSPQHGDGEFEQEARADGFDSAAAFCAFFVPKLGDVFNGALFKW